jgi:hypothetical protein
LCGISNSHAQLIGAYGVAGLFGLLGNRTDKKHCTFQGGQAKRFADHNRNIQS